MAERLRSAREAGEAAHDPVWVNPFDHAATPVQGGEVKEDAFAPIDLPRGSPACAGGAPFVEAPQSRRRSQRSTFLPPARSRRTRTRGPATARAGRGTVRSQSGGGARARSSDAPLRSGAWHRQSLGAGHSGRVPAWYSRSSSSSSSWDGRRRSHPGRRPSCRRRSRGCSPRRRPLAATTIPQPAMTPPATEPNVAASSRGRSTEGRSQSVQPGRARRARDSRQLPSRAGSSDRARWAPSQVCSRLPRGSPRPARPARRRARREGWPTVHTSPPGS